MNTRFRKKCTLETGVAGHSAHDGRGFFLMVALLCLALMTGPAWAPDASPSHSVPTTEPHALGEPTNNAEAYLSPEERHWLPEVKSLRLGYEVNRYPYSFQGKQGEFAGMAADYAQVLASQLGIRFELVPAQDWTELEHLIKTGAVDIIAATTPEDFQSADVTFTQAYERFPDVIVARMAGDAVMRMEDLAGRAVAVRDEVGLITRLRKAMPHSLFVPKASNEAGLASVASGASDGFVGTLPAVDSLLRDRYAGALRVVSATGLEQDLAFGVSDRYSALVPLMDRVLDHMTEEERHHIRANWLNVQYNFGIPTSQVLLGTAIAALLFGIMAVTQLRLRRAERNLAQQLALQVSIIDSLPYPVFLKGKTGRYVAVNKAYENMFSCKREDIVGCEASPPGHPTVLRTRDGDTFDAHALVSGEEVQRLAVVLQPETDDPKHALVWISRLNHGDSTTAGVLGTFVDVSDLREAETRASALEKRLNEICSTLPGAFFQIHIDASGSRRFNFVAGDTAAITGLTPADIIADESALFSRIHPDDQAMLLARWQTAGTHVGAMPAVDFRVSVNDTWRWLRTEGSEPRRLKNGSLEWAGYWVDTTATQAQQRELILARQEAETAMASRNMFFAMMSHEIRTPMVGVLGLIELIKKRSQDHLQDHLLAAAHSAATSLLSILDDILDYSRMESEYFSLERAPVDLRVMAEGVINLFAPLAREKGLDLLLNFDGRMAESHIADATRLRQVITNLLNNAIKFTTKGSVALNIDLLSEAVDVARVRMAVTDTGLGMTPEQQRHIFEPFHQADASTARQFGGSGLGLAICQRIAQAMGAELTIESSHGVGTTVNFELSLHVATQPSPIARLANKTVAIRTAREHIGQTLAQMMSSLGMHVIEAGVDDTPCPNDSPVDLLVMDEGLDISAARATFYACIQLDGTTEDSGISIGENGSVTLFSHPLLWSSVKEACEVALANAAQDMAVDVAWRPTASHARILVAEDNPVSRLVISEQLAELGYSTMLVEDGQRALDALRASRYDLLITDRSMPGMSGRELVRHIRSARPGEQGDIPILVMSASAYLEDVDRYRQAGADDFLAKPATLEELRRAISRRLVAGRS